jgi:hypothetical protein
MKYFRHFSDAHTSLKLQNLKSKLGLAGYGRYWLLLELLNSKFDGVLTTIEVHHKELATALLTRSKESTTKFIMVCHELAIIESVFETPTSLVLTCPILFKLMDKNSKYNRKRNSKQSQNATLEVEVEVEVDKEVDVDKDKPSFLSDPSCINFSQVADLFNQKLGGSGKIKHEQILQSGDVVKNFILKQSDFGLYSSSNWEVIFERVHGSEFIKKKLGVRSHFEWLLKEDNLKRLLRGDFDDNKNKLNSVDDLVNPFPEVANG